MNTKELKIKNLVSLYSSDIYKVCLHLSKDKRKAEEILVAVFLQVYLKMDKLEEDRGWNLSSKNKSDLVLSYLIGCAKRLSKEGRYNEETDKKN